MWATVTLGHIGNVSVLRLSRANSPMRRTGLSTACLSRQLAISCWTPPSSDLSTPSPQLALLIQQWIDALQVDSFGSWPVRVLKEHNALALHGNLIYLVGVSLMARCFAWITRHLAIMSRRKSTRCHSSPPSSTACGLSKSRDRFWFPPVETNACLTCNSLGYTEDEKEDENEKDGSTACMSCSGLGWWIAGR